MQVPLRKRYLCDKGGHLRNLQIVDKCGRIIVSFEYLSGFEKLCVIARNAPQARDEAIPMRLLRRKAPRNDKIQRGLTRRRRASP